MKFKNYLLIGLISSCFIRAYAQPGTVDPTFNPVDSGFWKGNALNSAVYTSAIQNDEKLIVGGNFTVYNGVKVKYLARFNDDGTLDNTFNIGTGLDFHPGKIALQSDGRIILYGNFHSYNGVTVNGIARLNPNGSLDQTFKAGAGVGHVGSTPTQTLCIQNDDKIIIGGSFNTYVMPHCRTTEQTDKFRQENQPRILAHLVAPSHGRLFRNQKS